MEEDFRGTLITKFVMFIVQITVLPVATFAVGTAGEAEHVWPVREDVAQLDQCLPYDVIAVEHHHQAPAHVQAQSPHTTKEHKSHAKEKLSRYYSNKNKEYVYKNSDQPLVIKNFFSKMKHI